MHENELQMNPFVIAFVDKVKGSVAKFENQTRLSELKYLRLVFPLTLISVDTENPKSVPFLRFFYIFLEWSPCP